MDLYVSAISYLDQLHPKVMLVTIGLPPMKTNPLRPLLLLVFLLTTRQSGMALPAPEQTGDKSPVAAELQRAEKLAKAQNWMEARSAYDHARELKNDWYSPESRLSVEGGIACSVKLQLWDDALSRSQNFITQNKGRFEEAIGERFLAGL